MNNRILKKINLILFIIAIAAILSALTCGHTSSKSSGWHRSDPLWKVKTVDVPSTLEKISEAAFSWNSNYFAWGNNTGDLEIFSVQPLKKLFSIKAHNSIITNISFSDDETLLATTGNYGYNPNPGKIKIWDVKTGTMRKVYEPPKIQAGRRTIAIESQLLRFKPGGKKLILVGNDKIVRTLNIKTGIYKNFIELKDKKKYNYEGYISPYGEKPAAIDSNCRYLSSYIKIVKTTYKDGKRKNEETYSIGIWDLTTRKLLKQYTIGKNTGKNKIYFLRKSYFSPDGKQLLITTRYKTLVTQWESGKIISSFIRHKTSFANILNNNNTVVLLAGSYSDPVRYRIIFTDAVFGRKIKSFVLKRFTPLAINRDAGIIMAGGQFLDISTFSSRDTYSCPGSSTRAAEWCWSLSEGSIKKLRWDEAKNYCRSKGLRVPNMQEFIDAVTYGGLGSFPEIKGLRDCFWTGQRHSDTGEILCMYHYGSSAWEKKDERRLTLCVGDPR
ncbi:MAG: WD40 repeat domain-containing protein [bacterium]|nr:WD40 repeat domain-containing protein [bacterium]